MTFLERFYASSDVPWGKRAGIPARRALSREKRREDPAERQAMETFYAAAPMKLTKRTAVSLLLLLAVVPLTLLFAFFLGNHGGEHVSEILNGRWYYLLSLALVVYAMIPFAMVFEGRRPQARELVLLACLSALAVAGRAAFFMAPNFKPVAAVVIITGVVFGGESGFLVGAVSMLVSNFLFGQGPWTPWQMFAMGLIGFLAGILYRKGRLKPKKAVLCLFGFAATLFVYGGIMNFASLMMGTAEFTWAGLLAVYIAGAPVDTVHAVSTVLFLWIGAKPLMEKLQRMKIKYGML